MEEEKEEERFWRGEKRGEDEEFKKEKKGGERAGRRKESIKYDERKGVFATVVRKELKGKNVEKNMKRRK